MNLKKKGANQRVGGVSLCRHESSVGAAPILLRRCFRDFRMDSEIYIYIYIYCIAENEWDEFKITKYSRENPIFDAEQIRMFLFHLFCTSCLI